VWSAVDDHSYFVAGVFLVRSLLLIVDDAFHRFRSRGIFGSGLHLIITGD